MQNESARRCTSSALEVGQGHFRNPVQQQGTKRKTRVFPQVLNSFDAGESFYFFNFYFFSILVSSRALLSLSWCGWQPEAIMVGGVGGFNWTMTAKRGPQVPWVLGSTGTYCPAQALRAGK